MIEKITSSQNKKIKEIVKLRKVKKRKDKDLFIIDGLREIKEAYYNDYKIEKIFICRDLIKKDYKFKVETIETDEAVFNKIAYPENPDGWLALVKPKKNNLKDINTNKENIIFILESIEKPGNLGAIIRTAKAFNINNIIINDEKVDLYNPNVIKSSTGQIFNLNIIKSSKEETLNWCKENKTKLLATTGKAKKSLVNYKFKNKTAFIFGSEPTGLSNFWLDNADDLIKIPINKNLDSLNVSVSAAIFAYEVFKQNIDSNTII